MGTIIVKLARLEARPEGQLFAMVKRGGRYNPEGARGWEWFELAERADRSVAIKWRGVSAPGGEQYGGDPHGTCNAWRRGILRVIVSAASREGKGGTTEQSRPVSVRRDRWRLDPPRATRRGPSDARER